MYLNWLCSHKGGIELYNQFIRHSGDEELNKIYSNYNIKDAEDKITIKNFFINFAEFFANLKLNENMNNLALLNNLENINNTIDTERKSLPVFPRVSEKAYALTAMPSPDISSAPVISIERAVSVHRTIVSVKT